MERLRIGLFGDNGHQLKRQLIDNPRAELVAAAAIDEKRLPVDPARIEFANSFEDLIANEKIDLISLCSPRRRDQFEQAMAAMAAGKHVYAEKPCAFTEAEIDRLIAAARENQVEFHEMCPTVVDHLYREMREAIQDQGMIGTVVQVLAQKCYPWHDQRPADEDIDGGLSRQVGIYFFRFVEHIAGVRIADIAAEETRLGNPNPDSECRRAVSIAARLENGGVASGVCNYLNPMRHRIHGYEIVRVFGTDGIIESDAEKDTVRYIPLGDEPRLLDVSGGAIDYFELILDKLIDGREMPLTLEDELSPTRWTARLKDKADSDA